jgi:hypothetical protein
LKCSCTCMTTVHSYQKRQCCIATGIMQSTSSERSWWSHLMEGQKVFDFVFRKKNQIEKRDTNHLLLMGKTESWPSAPLPMAPNCGENNSDYTSELL